jgi:L-alanine-DL-glutamate epimerase-like enolase superfamily enzyme
MKISTRPFRLELKRPFRLAVGERSHTDVVYVTLENYGLKTVGEASMPPYLGESVKSVMHFIESVNPEELCIEDLEHSKGYLDSLSDGNTAAKAAVEMALVSMAAAKKQQTVGDFLKIEDREIHTSYTVGISEENELREKLDEAEPFKYLKIKLGSSDDLKLLKTIGALSDKTFSVDVNQGWKSLEEALPVVKVLEEMACLFIEQPFAAKAISLHAELRSKTSIPIYADESIKRLYDLEQNFEAFDGVVVKLMKTAGPLEAIQMLNRARDLGLKTVMGCMAESSVAISMARVLAPLADYADLDGAFLMKNGPFGQVTYESGRVILVP